MRNSRRLAALIPLILLVLASLACDTPPFVGITCLYEQNGAIIAPEDSQTWISHDGGFTWTSTSTLTLPSSLCDYPRSFVADVADPSNPQILYRFQNAMSIERSIDGGNTWQLGVDLRGTDARTRYYQQSRVGAIEYYAGPMDAIIHSQTGNLIVAMGYEGVLVRTPDNAWHWQSVGQWYRTDMRNPFVLMSLLSLQVIVGIIFALLITLSIRVLAERWNVWVLLGVVISTYGIYWLALAAISALPEILGSLFVIALFVTPILLGWLAAKYVIKTRHVGGFVFTGLGWTFFGGALALCWLVIDFNFLNLGATPLPAIAMVIYAGVAWVLHLGEARFLWLRVGLGTLGFSAFILPYFLWGIGAIAFHEEAFWSSLVCAVIALAGSIILTKRLAPLDEKPPIPENPALRDVPSPAR